MITIVGNHIRNHLGRGINGVGTGQVVNGTATTTVAASEAGDQWVQQLAGLKSDLNMGVYVQATVAVELEFTLSQAGLAANPDPLVAADATWTPPIVLAPGEIKHIESIFTAMRMTFPAPGLLMYGVS